MAIAIFDGVKTRRRKGADFDRGKNGPKWVIFGSVRSEICIRSQIWVWARYGSDLNLARSGFRSGPDLVQGRLDWLGRADPGLILGQVLAGRSKVIVSAGSGQLRRGIVSFLGQDPGHARAFGQNWSNLVKVRLWSFSAKMAQNGSFWPKWVKSEIWAQGGLKIGRSSPLRRP